MDGKRQSNNDELELRVNRRDLLKTGVAGAAGLALFPNASLAALPRPGTQPHGTYRGHGKPRIEYAFNIWDWTIA